MVRPTLPSKLGVLDILSLRKYIARRLNAVRISCPKFCTDLLPENHASAFYRNTRPIRRHCVGNRQRFFMSSKLVHHEKIQFLCLWQAHVSLMPFIAKKMAQKDDIFRKFEVFRARIHSRAPFMYTKNSLWLELGEGQWRLATPMRKAPLTYTDFIPKETMCVNKSLNYT